MARWGIGGGAVNATLVAAYVAAVIITFVAGMWVVRDATADLDTIRSAPPVVLVGCVFTVAWCWPLVVGLLIGARLVGARGR